MPSDVGPAFRGDWRAVITGDEFVSAPEIGNKTPTLTIADVRHAEMESMDAGKGKRSTLAVYFREARKAWVLNKTNPHLLAAMFGADTTGWIGKRVTLYTTEVAFGPDRVLAIRVKGSPDIDRTITVSIKRPKRKPEQHTLVPTGNRSGTRSEVEDDDEHTPAEHARGEGL